jgi:hydrogenase expression/formation protein HypC
MCLAIPGKIVAFVPREANLGWVEVSGVRRKVDLGLLEDDPPRTGDWVLIHVGFAMNKIAEEEALEQIRILHLLGESSQALDEVRGYGLEDATEPAPEASNRGSGEAASA